MIEYDFAHAWDESESVHFVHARRHIFAWLCPDCHLASTRAVQWSVHHSILINSALSWSLMLALSRLPASKIFANHLFYHLFASEKEAIRRNFKFPSSFANVSAAQ